MTKFISKADFALAHDDAHRKQIRYLLEYEGTYFDNPIDEKIFRAILSKFAETIPDAISGFKINQRELAERAGIVNVRTVSSGLHRIFCYSEITTSPRGTSLNLLALFDWANEIVRTHTSVAHTSVSAFYNSQYLHIIKLFTSFYNGQNNSNLQIRFNNENAMFYAQKTNVYRSLISKNGLGYNTINILSQLIKGKSHSINKWAILFNLSSYQTRRRITAFMTVGIMEFNGKYKVVKLLSKKDLLLLCDYFHVRKFDTVTKKYIFLSEAVVKKHYLERKYYYQSHEYPGSKVKSSYEAFQDSILQNYNIIKQEDVKDMYTKKEDFFAGDVEDDFDSEAILVDIDNYSFDAEKMAENKSYFN
ncbi:MAG: hypothetical protein WAX33_04900, partial [Rectinemataceae bacterium]